MKSWTKNYSAPIAAALRSGYGKRSLPSALWSGPNGVQAKSGYAPYIVVMIADVPY